jgi:hypothetical protein
MENQNSREYLEKVKCVAARPAMVAVDALLTRVWSSTCSAACRTKVLQNLSMLEHAPSVQMHHVRVAPRRAAP